MKKLLAALGATLTFGFCSGYIAYAHIIPGWDEPYDFEAYYSLTEISWADSPSGFALRDLAANAGNVFDYTRYIKSVLFADNFNSMIENATSQTQLDVINSTPFDTEIFAETSDALKLVAQGTEQIAKTVDLEKHLLQGSDDEFQNFNPDLNHAEKFIWLDNQYKNFADGANVEVNSFQTVMSAADSVLNHSNMAQGDLQIQQARNELLTLLVHELARKNALDSNMAQMQALYQAAEYDSNVESAYIDSITKFDVADPYDTENYQLLKNETGYQKPSPVGMPDFK